LTLEAFILKILTSNGARFRSDTGAAAYKALLLVLWQNRPTPDRLK
jgi:hypothetical protein